MAYKEIEASSAPAWDFDEDPIVEGKYVGKRTGLGENNSTIYLLERKNGETVGVWDCAVLNNKFSSIGEGQIVKIEYKGKVKSQKRKGSSYKDFAVYVDDGN